MKKGFTLIELLIVIGILSVLATITVLVLNPAEILAQARDSQRLSDLNSLKSAIILYKYDQGRDNFLAHSEPNSCLVYGNDANHPDCSPRHIGKVTAYKDSSSVDGFGWVPINFSDISVGSPLSSLPIDPKHGEEFFYSYATSIEGTFEIDAKLESSKYSNRAENDGGNNNSYYEIGDDSGLSL
jgi:prepilin-type N-terminal cleavage/methylation domain-containing protein